MAVEVGMPRELSISSIISELYLKYLDNRRKRQAEKQKGEVIVIFHVIFIALFCISFLEEKYSPRALIVKKCVYSQC